LWLLNVDAGSKGFGGGATRPLLKVEVAEELHEDTTVEGFRLKNFKFDLVVNHFASW